MTYIFLFLYIKIYNKNKMKDISNYINEKLNINKDSKTDIEIIEPDDVKSLDQMISVISAKNLKPTIAVCTVTDNFDKEDMISIEYPLEIGSNNIDCGSSGINDIKNNKVNIRPAEPDEIKAWRKAEGVGQSARRDANTVEKVKEIKWIAASLGLGKKFINFFKS